MNNLKKIGLTALAGSLVSFSASAVEMAVSGTAEATYISKGGSGGGVAHTGNPMGLNTLIGFTGSGELDNGYSVTLYTAIADGHGTGRSSSHLTIDMGDMGSFSFDQGAGKAGIGKLENKGNVSVYEEADHGMADMHVIDANGASNVLAYSNSVAGVSFSIEYQPGVGGGASGDGGSSVATGTEINYEASFSPMEGLTVYGGYANESTTGSEDDTEMTGGITFVTGPITIGYQQSEVDPGSGVASQEVEAMGIAFAVNDALSVSYSSTENERDAVTGTAGATSEATALNATYTMGSASLRLFMGEQSDASYTSGASNEFTEVSLVLSF